MVEPLPNDLGLRPSCEALAKHTDDTKSSAGIISMAGAHRTRPIRPNTFMLEFGGLRGAPSHGGCLTPDPLAYSAFCTDQDNTSARRWCLTGSIGPVWWLRGRLHLRARPSEEPLQAQPSDEQLQGRAPPSLCGMNSGEVHIKSRSTPGASFVCAAGRSTPQYYFILYLSL